MLANIYIIMNTCSVILMMIHFFFIEKYIIIIRKLRREKKYVTLNYIMTFLYIIEILFCL